MCHSGKKPRSWPLLCLSSHSRSTPIQGCLKVNSLTWFVLSNQHTGSVMLEIIDVRHASGRGLTFPKGVVHNVHIFGLLVRPPVKGNALEFSSAVTSIPAIRSDRCFTILCHQPIWHCIPGISPAERPDLTFFVVHAYLFESLEGHVETSISAPSAASRTVNTGRTSRTSLPQGRYIASGAVPVFGYSRAEDIPVPAS